MERLIKACQGKEIVLMGEVDGGCLGLAYQCLLHVLQDQQVTDLVFTPELTEYECEEREDCLSYIPCADVVIFINGENLSDLDIGLKVSPYIINGIVCMLIDTKDIIAKHELIYTLNVNAVC